MAKRPIFIPSNKSEEFVKQEEIDFSWSAGNKDLFRRKWNDILIGE